MIRSVRRVTKGMTLAEVLIAGTLSAILLFSLSTAAGDAAKLYRTGTQAMGMSRDFALSLNSLMRTIRRSEDAVLAGGHGISLRAPSGQVVFYDWSGTPGDPLIMKIGAGPALPLIEGLNGLSFQVNTKDIKTINPSATDGQLLYFEHYADPEDWITLPLGTSDVYGIAFTISSAAPVEKITLDQVKIRIGAKNTDFGGLRIRLLETRASGVPTPVGPPIASKDYPWWDIPLAEWGGMQWLFYWATYALDPAFVIYPNRHYLLLIQSTGPGAAGMIRLRELLSDPGPDNGIRAIVSHDGGMTWQPDPGDVGSGVERDIPPSL